MHRCRCQVKRSWKVGRWQKICAFGMSVYIDGCMTFQDLSPCSAAKLCQFRAFAAASYPPCKPKRKSQVMELCCYCIFVKLTEIWNHPRLMQGVSPCTVWLGRSLQLLLQFCELFLFLGGYFISFYVCQHPAAWDRSAVTHRSGQRLLLGRT